MKSTTASTPANSNATPEPKTAAPVPKLPMRTEAERAEMRAAFAREYLVDRNPAAAAVRAGYGKANASRVGKGLLENELVKAELAKLGAAAPAATASKTKRARKSAAKVTRRRSRTAQVAVSAPAVELAASLAEIASDRAAVLPGESAAVEIISVDRSGRISIGDLALLPDGVHVVLDQGGLRVSVRRGQAA